MLKTFYKLQEFITWHAVCQDICFIVLSSDLIKNDLQAAYLNYKK